jgi:mRNA interferase MazF
MPIEPHRGELWLADLEPTVGHEQGGRRPVLIVSVDRFNRSRANLAVIVPLTSVIRGIPSHVVVQPPEGGLRRPSEIMCEAVRSIDRSRLSARWGTIENVTMAQVEERLRVIMGLHL